MERTKQRSKACFYALFFILVFILASATKPAFALQKLDTPKNLRWDGMVARWDEVPNASGYSISVELVRDNSVNSYADYTTDAFFDAAYHIRFLANQTGLLEGTITYRFCVTARTNDYDHYVGGEQSDYSPLLEYTIPSKTKLETPTNLHWDGMIARWDPVPNASGYSISVELVRDNSVSSYAAYVTENYLDATDRMVFLADQTGLLEGVVTYRFNAIAQTTDYEHYVGSDRSEYSPLQPCVIGYKNYGLSLILDVASVMKLPDHLEAIASDAFAHTSCEAIIIPDGCVSIGDHAFAWCDDLLYVRIPKSVTDLAPNAFEGSGKVYIDCEQ